MRAIVTVYLNRNIYHNPKNKISGECPINSLVHCTDITGEHHSYIEDGEDIEDIRNKAMDKYPFITRIEEIP